MDIAVELQKLIELLRREQVAYALCGGFALAVYGITRATEDIDLLVEESSVAKIRKVTATLGYRFDARPMSFRGGDVCIHRLHKTESEDLLVLDLLLVTPVTQAAWNSRREIETDFGKVQVVSPSGLIHLKSLRGSGQDQDDIRQLKELPNES
jgi:hypothetical protein